MKVMFVNGSSHLRGTTMAAIEEMEKVFRAEIPYAKGLFSVLGLVAISFAPSFCYAIWLSRATLMHSRPFFNTAVCVATFRRTYPFPHSP